jgi:hypothetical protein
MRLSRTSDRSLHEPVGIVIADGGAEPRETRFLAYVWGPVPDELDAVVPETEREPLAVAAVAV